MYIYEYTCRNEGERKYNTVHPREKKGSRHQKLYAYLVKVFIVMNVSFFFG